MASDKPARKSVSPPLGLPELLTRAKVEAARLAKVTRWSPAFRHATAELPAMVARLDQDGVYYCLVAFAVGERVTGRIRLNAHTGKYAEAMGVETAGGGLERFRTADDARKRFLRGLPSSLPPSRLPVIDPILVWQPCTQAPSAFLPFYRVTEQRKVRYYRIDGKQFELIERGAGI